MQKYIQILRINFQMVKKSPSLNRNHYFSDRCIRCAQILCRPAADNARLQRLGPQCPMVGAHPAAARPAKGGFRPQLRNRAGRLRALPGRAKSAAARRIPRSCDRQSVIETNAKCGVSFKNVVFIEFYSAYTHKVFFSVKCATIWRPSRLAIVPSWHYDSGHVGTCSRHGWTHFRRPNAKSIRASTLVAAPANVPKIFTK